MMKPDSAAKRSRSFTVKGYWLYAVVLFPWLVGVLTIIRWLPWP